MLPGAARLIKRLDQDVKMEWSPETFGRVKFNQCNEARLEQLAWLHQQAGTRPNFAQGKSQCTDCAGGSPSKPSAAFIRTLTATSKPRQLALNTLPMLPWPSMAFSLTSLKTLLVCNPSLQAVNFQ